MSAADMTAQAVRPDRRAVPSWLAPLALGLCIVGLALGAYLTYEHLTAGATLACPATETVNCAKVTSSQWATLLGIPVAVLGVVFFAVMLVLCLPAVLRRPSRWLDAVRLGFCGVGLLTVLYLLWAELFQIGAICLWCTGVHVVTFLLFATLLVGQVFTDTASPAPDAGHR